MLPDSPDIAGVLALLAPQDIVSHRKCRVGPRTDGGYVMFDALDGAGPVYSFGIGANVGFDEDFAQRGRSIFMFDHMIERLPKQHPAFHFMRRGISARDDAAKQTFSLDYFIRELGHAGRRDLILKMDVEGAEWDVLAEAAPADLDRFQQIVLEVHCLLQLGDPEFRGTVARALRKMNENFLLGHVHANNYGRLGVIDGFAVADVLELTYIRKDLAVGRPSRAFYPLAIDHSNQHHRPDILLWFYPFLPERPIRNVAAAVFSYGVFRFIPVALRSFGMLAWLRIVAPLWRA
jgi:hypothetical protein